MTLKRVSTSDPVLQRIQDNTAQALTPLETVPMVGGAMLTGISLVSGVTNSVAHGLQRAPGFWIVSDQSADSRVWRSSDSDDRFIYLQCSASCTVSLWVN